MLTNIVKMVDALAYMADGDEQPRFVLRPHNDDPALWVAAVLDYDGSYVESCADANPEGAIAALDGHAATWLANNT